jgi:hypothetical protein
VNEASAELAESSKVARLGQRPLRRKSMGGRDSDRCRRCCGSETACGGSLNWRTVTAISSLVDNPSISFFDAAGFSRTAGVRLINARPAGLTAARRNRVLEHAHTRPYDVVPAGVTRRRKRIVNRVRRQPAEVNRSLEQRLRADGSPTVRAEEFLAVCRRKFQRRAGLIEHRSHLRSGEPQQARRRQIQHPPPE